MISKSSRHSKITGDFGEALVLYWLSKHGFECARVDHTGLDLIARNPQTRELMGLSVKSRSRKKGTERSNVRIDLDDLRKVKAASKSFGCSPHFAIVVDAADIIRVFILPLSRLLKLFPRRSSSIARGMTQRHLDSYYRDSDIKVFELRTETRRWW